jgi:hypothetical protein
MNRFALRLVIAGIPCVLIGIAWFIDSFGNDNPDAIFTGGRWKGPLLFAAGLAATIMGIRELTQPPKDDGLTEST